MVAGIIAGSKFGVAPKVKIIPLKAFRGTEADIDDVVDAIKYGYNMGIRIFNCSWDTEVYSEKLYTIMKECSDAIFVCSGGKNSSNVDEQHVYPGCFELPNVICVGGLGINGKIYKYSGYGEKLIYTLRRRKYIV